jgi:hypothetical protein
MGGARELLGRAPKVTGFTATAQCTLHYRPEPESKGLVERLSIRNGGRTAGWLAIRGNAIQLSAIVSIIVA